jgi:hypothetical protein
MASVVLLLGSATLVSVPVAQADPGPGSPIPADDPFYDWDGGLDVSPGTVLRSRPMTFRTPTQPTPITGSQVLYRTTDQQGDGVVTVATVLRPLVPGPTRIVSYHMAYDALGSQCNPSYTLSGGSTSPIAGAEQAVIAGEWTIGRQSGYAALDGIRAAQSLLQLPSSTPVGMVGYSGGSVPTQWGAEVAPEYAPELNLVGAAAGGLPVDLAHNLPYVSGNREWAGVIPALIVAYERAYGLDLNSFISDYGFEVIDQVDQECIAQFADDYPTLTDASMVKAPYNSLLDVPEVVAAIDDNIMGSQGTPRTPMFLAVGHADPIGDTVMITGDVQGLAYGYCGRGVDVQYAQYDGLTHSDAFPVFEAQSLQFLTERFSGGPTHSNCVTIPPGDALTPTS